MKTSLKVFAEKGFSMTFENGLTISVMFGGGNYCANYSARANFSNSCKFEHESPNAEVAIWDENDVWFNFGNDQVKGYLSPDEVGQWIAKVRRAKSLKSLRK